MRLLLSALFAITAASPAFAAERLTRQLDARQGLPVTHITSLAQDDRGFLWFGTPGGLVRYDGAQLLRVPGTLPVLLVTTLQGRVFAVAGYERHLYEATLSGFSAAILCGAAPCEGVTDLTQDGNQLLLAASGRVFRGAPDALEPLPQTDLPGRRIHLARPDGTRLWLGSNDGVYLWEPGTRPHQRLQARYLTALIPGWAGTFDGHVYQLSPTHDAVERYRQEPIERVVSIAARGGTVWVSFAAGLVAIREQAVERIGPDQVPSGGPLLVDHEGSLWLGTYRGLYQYPEPETYALNTGDGFPSPHARFITPGADTSVVTTWAGSVHLRRDAGRVTVDPAVEEPSANGRVCLDVSGRAWTGHAGAAKDKTPPDEPYTTCAPSKDGSIWLGFTPHLYRAHPDGLWESFGLLPYGEGRDTYTDALYEDPSGTLWVGMGERICSIRVTSLEAGSRAWQCTQTQAHGGYHAAAFLEADGELLLGTKQGGLFRLRRDGTFEQHPGSKALPSLDVAGLGPSPRGGFWITGQGILRRVRSREDRLEVLEAPGAWQGVMSANASDVLEEDDGTLLIASDVGLIVVPPEARDARPSPPQVELTSVRGSQEDSGSDGTLALPNGPNWLELSFAALSYRDPTSLRYRVRLGPDHEWTSLKTPTFRFADVAAGHHVAEVAASLDGSSWSASPAALTFTVHRPWYASPWPWTAALAVAALAAFALQRARLSLRLREERLRARMAMDLHDELGSGLGSIGILAGLAGEDALSEAERRELAAKIADTAGELGGSLSDIVWSLRPSSATLEALLAYVTDRAARLFPNDDPKLMLDLPRPVPQVPLTLATCRAVQLIAVEALHNAQKHAQARRVYLRLTREGRRFRLTVEDDGRGHDDAQVRAFGMGQVSMRQRAREIGAWFEYKSAKGQGTSVSVCFDPEAAELPARSERGRAVAAGTPDPGGGG